MITKWGYKDSKMLIALYSSIVCIQLFFNIILDSKRQQTTTVDNKRLFNGLVLTRVASLQWK